MDKLKLEQDIKNGLSTRSLAKKYGIGQSTIRYWLKKYNLKTTPNYKHSYKLREPKLKYDPVKIQQMIDVGHTYRTLKTEIGISAGTLSSLSKNGLIKFKTRSELGKEKFKKGTHPFFDRKNHVYTKPRGGYRKYAGRGRGLYVIDSFNNKVYLQSSFEEQCFKILTNLNIRWIRPEPLEYTTDKVRKYYPDFYLIDYDLFLDPKNDYLIIKDTDKIKKVIDENNVKVLIISKENLTEDYIKSVL